MARAKKDGVSLTDYARHAGVVLPTVSNWKKAGKLVLFADGSVNVKASDARRFQNTDPSLRSSGNDVPLKPVPSEAVAVVHNVLRESGFSVPSVGGMTFMQARTANEVLKAAERKLKLERLNGGLVDAKMVRATVSAMAIAERDAILQLPSRFAAIMAAELGVSELAVRNALESVLRQHLSRPLEDVKL